MPSPSSSTRTHRCRSSSGVLGGAVRRGRRRRRSRRRRPISRGGRSHPAIGERRPASAGPRSSWCPGRPATSRCGPRPSRATASAVAAAPHEAEDSDGGDGRLHWRLAAFGQLLGRSGARERRRKSKLQGCICIWGGVLWRESERVWATNLSGRRQAAQSAASSSAFSTA